MNFRTKTTAMVLCFFLGLLGMHWFYLGKPAWGRIYLILCLALWPAAFMILMLFAFWFPALVASACLFAWAGHVLLSVLVVYDFCCLVSMHPQRFDLEFNR